MFSRREGRGVAALSCAAALALALTAACGLAGCAGGSGATSGSDTASDCGAVVVSDATAGAGATGIDASALFSDRDLDPSYDEVAATVTLSGADAQVEGTGAAWDGSDLTITAAGSDGSITGGTLMAVGASGMAQNLGESSTQVSLLVSASGAAGDAVTLTDAEGTVLASFSPTRSYQCVVVSAPGMEVGETYTLSCGSTSAEVTADSVSVSQVGLGGVMGQVPGGGMGGDFGGVGGQAPGEMGQMGTPPDAMST